MPRAVAARSRNRSLLGASIAVPAIHHPAADEFLLLGHALGPDHSHGELLRTWHSDECRGPIYTSRGSRALVVASPSLLLGDRFWRCETRSGRGLFSSFALAVFFRAPILPPFYAVAQYSGFIYAGICLSNAVLARETFRSG